MVLSKIIKRNIVFNRVKEVRKKGEEGGSILIKIGGTATIKMAMRINPVQPR